MWRLMNFNLVPASWFSSRVSLKKQLWPSDIGQHCSYSVRRSKLISWPKKVKNTVCTPTQKTSAYFLHKQNAWVHCTVHWYPLKKSKLKKNLHTALKIIIGRQLHRRPLLSLIHLIFSSNNPLLRLNPLIQLPTIVSHPVNSFIQLVKKNWHTFGIFVP
jgi:hypothetical protein